MLNCVIVDDEKAAIESLKWKLEDVDIPVSVLKSFTDPIKAVEELSNSQFDILFLDIEMPGLDGFEVLERLKKTEFAIVFVTAHDEYVLKALRSSAVDYLTKPVDVKDLASALIKVRDELQTKDYRQLYQLVLDNIDGKASSNRKIAIPTADAIQFVPEADIVFCNSSSNYTILHLKDGSRIVVSKTLKSIEGMLSDRFLRIHNSYIVHLDYIVSYQKGSGGNVELKTGDIVPVSKSRKEVVLERLGNVK